MTDWERKQRLRDAGWKYSSTGPCRECGELLEFWIAPGKRGARLDYIGLRLHECKAAAAKRKLKKPAPVQLSFLEEK